MYIYTLVNERYIIFVTTYATSKIMLISVTAFVVVVSTAVAAAAAAAAAAVFKLPYNLNTTTEKKFDSTIEQPKKQNSISTLLPQFKIRCILLSEDGVGVAYMHATIAMGVKDKNSFM
uniref:Uncharacterized protein n=1 Tax=Glossina brevipalpis TaxID=37001 RepID=A0A1A9WCD6_9MUSC